uniref:Uncharacterized protein n=1 Tax=Globodera pallida TaxID=36090 RepID=A0A183BN57_GLOPA
MSFTKRQQSNCVVAEQYSSSGVAHIRQAAAAAAAVVPLVQHQQQQNSHSSSSSSRHQRRQRRHALHATMALFRCAAIVSVICAQISAVVGLTCYETVLGKTTIVQNDSWTYCALVPATIVSNELVNGSQFGLGPDNDMMAAYNTAFAMSVEEYRILTVCIYERYDFSRFLTIKPDLAVEFAFRCVCNYDLCNSEPTFSAYLSTIKSESFARR